MLKGSSKTGASELTIVFKNGAVITRKGDHVMILKIEKEYQNNPKSEQPFGMKYSDQGHLCVVFADVAAMISGDKS